MLGSKPETGAGLLVGASASLYSHIPCVFIVFHHLKL